MITMGCESIAGTLRNAPFRRKSYYNVNGNAKVSEATNGKSWRDPIKTGVKREEGTLFAFRGTCTAHSQVGCRYCALRGQKHCSISISISCMLYLYQ